MKKSTSKPIKRAGASAKAKALSASAIDFLKGNDTPSDNAAQMTNAYAQSVWVYACVSRKAEQLAQTQFKFSKGQRRGENVIETGDLYDLWQNPHALYDGFEFKELLASWMMLRGEAFCICLDDAGEVLPMDRIGGRGGRVRSMLLLPPDKFTEVIDSNRLVGWRYSGSSQDPFPTTYFLPEEIIHAKIANPFTPWRGMSPLTVARLAAQADYASAQFNKGLMLNNADTGVIITTEQILSAEQREAIEAALRMRKRKAGTADRPLFLHGGAKLEKPALSAADMQFLENRKFNRQEICAVFGVPQEILGFTEDANRSVSDSARLNFIENSMMPLGDRIESAFSRVVRAFGENLYGWFDWDGLPIMQAARRNRVDTAVKLFNMAVPFNDINRNLDLGFPDYKWHGVGYLSYALMPVGTKSVLVQEGEELDTAPPADNEEKNNPFARTLALLNKATAPAPAPVHTCNAQAGEYAAAMAGSVKLKRRALQTYFFGQRKRVLAALKAESEKAAPFAEQRAYEDIFNLNAENAELIARLKPMLIADLEFGGAQLFAELGADSFQLKPQAALDFLATRENVIRDINETTFDRIREQLREGLEKGESYADLAARVKEVYNDASEQRAESIALTETNIAINSGRMEGMRNAKVEKKGWGASQLEGVRASHLRAEQDYKAGIPLDQPFRVGGFELDHPGDPKGPPQETINCRCFLFAVLSGKAVLPTKMLRYEAWLAAKSSQPKGEPNP